MSLLHPMKLFTSDDYTPEVVKSIHSARHEIAIIATTFRSDDERSEAIIEALCNAADRGVAISIYADTFTYLEPKEFILFSPKRQPSRAVQAMRLERRLKRHGIQFYWLGRKANIILTGRTHTKWIVVDDIVYSFGGLNLDNESLTNIDYMFRVHDSKLAETILAEHVRIRRADRGGAGIRNHTYKLDELTDVLFDGGLIGSSLIYRRTVTLARQAEHVTLVSQYCPTGPLTRILKAKHATVYYNHWRNASSVNRALIGLGMLSAKSTTAYKHDAYLHAKFAIFTMPNGDKVAISGSHNFMFGSGVVGTREVALETTDHRIIRQLEKFFERYVA